MWTGTMRFVCRRRRCTVGLLDAFVRCTRDHRARPESVERGIEASPLAGVSHEHRLARGLDVVARSKTNLLECRRKQHDPIGLRSEAEPSQYAAEDDKVERKRLGLACHAETAVCFASCTLEESPP